MKKIFLFCLMVSAFAFGDCGELLFNSPPTIENLPGGLISGSAYTRLKITFSPTSYIVLMRYYSGTRAGTQAVSESYNMGALSAPRDCVLAMSLSLPFSDESSLEGLSELVYQSAVGFDLKNQVWEKVALIDENTVLSRNEDDEYILFHRNPDGTFTASRPTGDDWEDGVYGSTWAGSALFTPQSNPLQSVEDSESTVLEDVATLTFGGDSSSMTASQGAAMDNPLRPADSVPDTPEGYSDVALDRELAVAVAEGTKEGFADVVRAVEGIEAGSGSVEVQVDVTVTNDFGDPPDDLWVPEMWESPAQWQISEKEGMDSEFASKSTANAGLLDEFLTFMQEHLTLPEYNASFGTMPIVYFNLQAPGNVDFSGEIDLEKFYVSHIRNFFLFLFGICSMFLIVRAIAMAW